MSSLYQRSPVDCFGYRYKCCHCIPLKAACIVICVLSFLFAAVELAKSDRFLRSVLRCEGVVLTMAKVAHLFVIALFLVSCGALMFGLIIVGKSSAMKSFSAYLASGIHFTKRSIPIHVYVWSAFIFNCICVVLTVIELTFQGLNYSKVNRRTIMIVVLNVLWYALFLYFINVVNSYRAQIVVEYHFYYT